MPFNHIYRETNFTTDVMINLSHSLNDAQTGSKLTSP